MPDDVHDANKVNDLDALHAEFRKNYKIGKMNKKQIHSCANQETKNAIKIET